MINETKLQKHVTFCGQEDINLIQRGRQAELYTVSYLVDNLNTRSAGNYHILMNYNMPIRTRGAVGSLEIDLIVIARPGIFLLEVKDWWGIIEATDQRWVLNQKYEHENVFDVIDHKARVLYGNWFGPSGKLRQLGKISVVSLIVLFNGTQNFINRTSNRDSSRVLDLSNNLLQALSSNVLIQNSNSVELSDDVIQQVRTALFNSFAPNKEERVREYQIIGMLSPGHLFDSFEAVHTITKNRRVRIKRYRLESLAANPGRLIEQYSRSAEATFALGYHPNIVQTVEFFKDTHRPDLFYEVTEYIQGDRLDGIMARTSKSLSLSEQLDYLEPLCAALMHAHAKEIYHRNLNSETIFVSKGGVIKLGDFDFAKIMGAEYPTIAPGLSQRMLVPVPKGNERVNPVIYWSLWRENPATAPELRDNASDASPASDIYSLGVLWYLLASLPAQQPPFGREKEPKAEVIDELNLPAAGRVLLKQMVAKELVKRPPSVATVYEQLKLLRKELES